MERPDERLHEKRLETLEKPRKVFEVKIFNMLFNNVYASKIISLLVLFFLLYFGIEEVSDTVQELKCSIENGEYGTLPKVIFFIIKSSFAVFITIFFVGITKYIVGIFDNQIEVYKALKYDYKYSIDNMELLKKSIDAQEKEVSKTNRTITKDIISLNNGQTEHLESKILEKILRGKISLSQFLVKHLKFKPTESLTNEILEAFEDAKKTKVAKACCVINNTKFIKGIKDLNHSDITSMLRYFMGHQYYTDGNLIISRIFSFKFQTLNNDDIVLEATDNDYKYILYLYLIANYYSGVNTYLHLYNSKLKDRCTENDYVSLSYFDNDKMSYKAFFSPSVNIEASDCEENSTNQNIESVISIDNDIMLAKALELDFKSKLDITDITEMKKYVDSRQGIIKIKPKDIDKIHKHLGLTDKTDKKDKKDEKDNIKTTLIEHIKTLKNEELKDDYTQAINQFFA